MLGSERAVYRCVHPGGVIEYRGVPLLEADCVLLERRILSTEPEAAVSDSGVANAAAADQDTFEDPRVHNCEVARDNLEMLESGVPVVITGPDGEAALLSESDREERLRQTRRDVDYWCDGETSGTR